MAEENQYLTEDHYLVCPKAVAFKKMKVTSQKLALVSGTKIATTEDTMKGNAFICVGGNSGIFGMSILGVAALGAGIAIACLAIPVFGWVAAAIIAAAIALAMAAGYLKCKANASERKWVNYNENFLVEGNPTLIVKESTLFCVPEATYVETKETFWEALFSQTMANLGHIANFCEMFLTGLGIGGLARAFVKEGGKAALKLFGETVKNELKDMWDPRSLFTSLSSKKELICRAIKGFGMYNQYKGVYDTLTDEELSAFEKAKNLGLDFIQSIFSALGSTYVCFPAGTLVHTEKGLIPIESLHIGDLVWTYNEKTGEKELKPIRVTHKRVTTLMMTVELANGTIFEVTPEHRFFTDNHWKEIKEIKALEKVQLFSGDPIEITNLALVPRLKTVYNFDVQDNENYYVTEEGILVHNGYKAETDQFTNELPDELARELEEAKRLGVEPTSINNLDEFEEMVNNAEQIKWAMLDDGSFVAMPKYVDGIELKHTVLTGGNDVISAGEGFITGNKEIGFFGELNNNSGHYKPSETSVEKVKDILGDLFNF